MTTKKTDLMTRPTYNPHPLLDALSVRLKAKNDAGLSKALQLAPPVISKIRHRRVPVTAETLLRMHDVSGLPVNDLRKLMGVPALDRSLKPEVANA